MIATFDAIVVGAGYIGCSIAYHLSAAGLRTVLIERGDVAAGASRANYGNVQVQDAELGRSLPLVMAGFQRFAQLDDELGYPTGYRSLGSLLLVENEAQWRAMASRLPALHAAGIQAEIAPAERLKELEPLLDRTQFLGACYHAREGQVQPFLLMWAYIRRARALGLTLQTHTELLGFDLAGGCLCGVRTNRGSIGAGAVVLATGAWSPAIGSLLNRHWDVKHVRGQALATEPVQLRLHNHIASAAFFDQIEGGAEAALAVSQTAHGNILLGEAAVVTHELDSSTSPTGPHAIAALASRYFPELCNVRVLRNWAAPVAFTDDDLPFLGAVADVPGLYLATAFKSTVVVTPIVGELVAQLVAGKQPALDLSAFNPGRSMACSQQSGK